MSDGDENRTGPPATLDDRPDYHPVRWVLLSGSRLRITLLFLGVILLSLLSIGALWEFEMERLVNETQAVQTMFNTLLGGIILFVSVVVSINTAALSQDLDPLRARQLQIEKDIEFRSDLGAFVDAGIIPSDIDGFFRSVLRVLRSEADALRAARDDAGSRPTREEVVAFVDDLDATIATVERRLERRNQRLSTTLLAGVDWDAVHHITLAYRLLVEHGDDLRPSERDSLTNLIELLTTFASGREFFTTLYFKRKLRRLSSSLVLLSLPVIVFTAYVLLAIDAGLFPTQTVFGTRPRLLYVGVAFVVAISPYVLLSAFMLRIVTVSKYTLAAGGFTVATAEDG